MDFFENSLSTDLLEMVENEELFTDIVTEDAILVDKKNNFSLHTNSDRDKFTGDGAAYFKWVNATSFGKASEVARISFNDASYQYHVNHGKATAELSRDEKKDMVKLLQKPATEDMKNQVESDELKEKINTGWDYLKYMHNIHNGFTDEDMLGKTNLGSDKVNLLDIDTPMPDYSDLPSVKRKDRNKKKNKGKK